MNVDFITHRPPAPQHLRGLPTDPLSDASLTSLRLLVGFLLLHHRPSPGVRRWLDDALCTDGNACRAVPRLVALACASPAARHEIDRWFDRELGEVASPFVALSPFELAAVWAHHRADLRGPALAAFLWQVARRNDLPGRRLAERVARGIEPRDLMPEAFPTREETRRA